MFDKLREFLLPSPCALCLKPAGRKRNLCQRCENSFPILKEAHRCRLCLAPLYIGADICGNCLRLRPNYQQLVATGRYQSALRQSIIHFKFYGRSDLHVSLGNLIADRLCAVGAIHYDVIVPVPLSKARFSERGYNQSALLAKQISARLQIPYDTNSLIRHKDTKRQSELPKRDRQKNVRNAFTLIKEETTYQKRILLVDDIFTTGATMVEAAKTIHNAKSICACVVAITADPRFQFDD